MNSSDLEILILLSGGLDSTACTHLYVKQKKKVSAIFIDYGQLAAQKEKVASRKVCEYYGINLKEVTFNGLPSQKGNYIQGRNLFLVSAALLSANMKSGIIAIGLHAGSPYPDCTENFISSCRSLFDLYNDGTIYLSAPFLKLTKQNIIQYIIKHNVPLEITYSCELGLKQPCGQCSTCRDLESLDVS